MTLAILKIVCGMFVAVLGGNGFWDWLKSKKGKKSNDDRMLLAIGRDRLNILCKKHLKAGYIPEDEFESFEEMGNAYIAKGGNSKVKAMFEDAMKLPKQWE